MYILRCVSLVAKPLVSSLSPRVAPVLWAPCRSITTSQDHVRFGNVGGRMSQDRDLDVLLGRWIYDPDNPLGDKISPEVRALLSEEHINISRNNGTWIFQTGVKGYGSDITYKFKLNTIFLVKYQDGTIYRGIALKMGNNGLGFTFSTLTSDSVISGFTSQVEKDTLFVRTLQLDGKKTSKVFIRD